MLATGPSLNVKAGNSVSTSFHLETHRHPTSVYTTGFHLYVQERGGTANSAKKNALRHPLPTRRTIMCILERLQMRVAAPRSASVAAHEDTAIIIPSGRSHGR